MADHALPKPDIDTTLRSFRLDDQLVELCHHPRRGFSLICWGDAGPSLLGHPNKNLPDLLDDVQWAKLPATHPRMPDLRGLPRAPSPA